MDLLNFPVEANFGKVDVPHPEQNLFLWALLLNRIDIAHLFWQIGEHHICSALFASNLLKSISTRLSDLEKEIMKHAKYAILSKRLVQFLKDGLLIRFHFEVILRKWLWAS